VPGSWATEGDPPQRGDLIHRTNKEREGDDMAAAGWGGEVLPPQKIFSTAEEGILDAVII